jgi:hypothetical protein
MGSKLIDLKTGKAVEENSPRSARYDSFLEQVKHSGAKVEREINSVYRYTDPTTGKEKIRWYETLKGMRGDGAVGLTCTIGRNILNPQKIELHQMDQRRKEAKLREDDAKSTDYDFNAKNLAKIKSDCGEQTNYYIETNKLGACSTITAEQFFSGKRDEIINSFTAVKKDFADMIRQMAQQTK